MSVSLEKGNPADRNTGRVLFLIYLSLLFLYMLTAAGRLGNSDAGSMFAVTKSLYTHRWIDVGPCRPQARDNQCVPGVDGRQYSGYGLVSSAIVYPAFSLGWRAAAFLHKDPAIIAGMAVSFTNVFLTPLIPVILCAWLLRLGYGVRASAATALTLGVATPLWFHGVKGFFSEPHFTLAFLTCCFLVSRNEKPWNAWLAGLCFGAACGSRIYGLILFPVLMWYLYTNGVRAGLTRPVLWGRAVGFSLMLGLCLVVICYFNYARFGSILKTGYQLAFPTPAALLATPFLHGLSGLLFNGEVGLLWYAPLVVLLPWVWGKFHREQPDVSWLCAAACLLSLCFYSKYAAWHGGWSYGPRLLVPIMPFLVMPLAAFYQALARMPLSKRTVLPLGIIAASVLIQIMGLTSSTARYYNLSGYYQATGRSHWWGDSALLQNVAALPKLMRPQSGMVTAHASSAAEREAAGTSPQSYPSPDAYLQHFPNSINLTAYDIWLVKATALGLSKKLVWLAGAVLFAGFFSSLRLLIACLRMGGRDKTNPPLPQRAASAW